MLTQQSMVSDLSLFVTHVGMADYKFYSSAMYIIELHVPVCEVAHKFKVACLVKVCISLEENTNCHGVYAHTYMYIVACGCDFSTVYQRC